MNALAKFMDRHERVALQFSGGKDSLACLHITRPWWDRMLVLWCNTGAAFPETLEQMKELKKQLPWFVELRSNQPEQNERCGPPSDLVPSWDLPFGRLLEEGRQYRVQTPFSCCGENIWGPLYGAVKEMGVTGVLRGQRDGEAKKATIRSGFKEDGIEYFFPIENWSADQVWQYLDEQGVEVPRHYRYFDSSLDCTTCTGFWDPQKMRYLEAWHPSLRNDVLERFRYIEAAVSAELVNLREMLK